MNYILFCGILSVTAVLAARFGFAWQLLLQNGRMLLRLEALEKRLEEIGERITEKAETDAERGISEASERADRFGNHSLANSKIKRDGLKAGTPAPEFRLPRLGGGELSLSELRGRLVLLVFSSPHCGPCNTLAPKLQKFHRKHPELELVMISRE